MSEKILVPVLGESINEATVSPSFFNHLETVASVILSPKTGTNIFSLILNYSKTFLIISCCCEMCLFA